MQVSMPDTAQMMLNAINSCRLLFFSPSFDGALVCLEHYLGCGFEAASPAVKDVHTREYPNVCIPEAMADKS